MVGVREPKELSGLVELASRLGASEAKVISTADISVEDDLGRLCLDCENYGLSSSCPPYVSGPSGFRELLRSQGLALVFKMDLPTGILFSNERSEVFGLLHEIASGIEHSAAGIGYPDSKAYAGGSCKTIFCQDQPNCRMKDGEGQCRNPLHARPSMSGFGINVSKLIRAAGWTMNWSTPGTTSNKTAMGTVCGLVLIG